uniref:Ig-like domain-containing protein n=1 Tax=Xiphophorus couchianus TaxID=32473 RepID=A0A3B5MDT6_9TELE
PVIGGGRCSVERGGRGTFSLLVGGVSEEDLGCYTCQATNEAGSRQVTVEILLEAETAPPTFIQRLQSSTVRQGSQVRLSVRVSGIPTPVVKFYREGAEIQSSADFQILQDGDLYSLLIAEAFPEDSGAYSVTTTNSSGRATSTCELLVQGEFSPVQILVLTVWIGAKLSAVCLIQVKKQFPLRKQRRSCPHPRWRCLELQWRG